MTNNRKKNKQVMAKVAGRHCSVSIEMCDRCAPVKGKEMLMERQRSNVTGSRSRANRFELPNARHGETRSNQPLDEFVVSFVHQRGKGTRGVSLVLLKRRIHLSMSTTRQNSTTLSACLHRIQHV